MGTTIRTTNNHSSLFSNWSIAEEIKRLKAQELIGPVTKIYQFHKQGCSCNDTPDENSNAFVKNGIAKSGAIRYKCKTCDKNTNVNKDITKNFNYLKKRNDVLVPMMNDIMYHMPVTKICERNNISPLTFYRKLEIIYQKCLEFLERNEAKLSSMKFDDLYLVTDTFEYTLNNIRKKGFGNSKKNFYEKAEAKEAKTSMTATADVISNYVFRADLSYDTNISLANIEEDTKEYHCDHTYLYLRKNQRIQSYSYHPQPPTINDSETKNIYKEYLGQHESRKSFVDGLHVSKGYTTIAQLHLLKETLNYNRIVFVSDDDKSIRQAVFRVFKDDFRNNNALYFTSQYLKTTKITDSFVESEKARRELQKWGKINNIQKKGLQELAIQKIYHDLNTHSFYKYDTVGNKTLPKPANNKLSHPLPAKDEGNRYIDLISYNSAISRDDLAEVIVNINMRAINNFFQELRRDVNLLERPIVGSRGAGKTYIYANYNPLYAHMLITIFRTYYNFIKGRKYYDTGNKKITPAQRIGLSEKKFTVRDIIYFR